MTSTIQQFKWVDRDTAARDLLQVAYHAPGYISQQAWKLLSAIRSPVLIPELKEVALNANHPHAYDAYHIIVSTPGNFYFPEFEPPGNDDLTIFRIASLTDLLRYHPINQEWVLPIIDRALPDQRLQLLRNGLHRNSNIFVPLLTAFYDLNPTQLDLNQAYQLYQTGHQEALKWLENHWDDLIYLCLCDIEEEFLFEKKFFHLLEAWPELKTELFRRCPAIQEEVEQQKKAYEQKHPPLDDIRMTPRWKKMERVYEQARQGDEAAFEALYSQSALTSNSWETALATYFIGQLIPENDRALNQCLSHLKNKDIHLRFFSSQIIDEALIAVCEIRTPIVWETMIEAYFLLPVWSFEKRLHRWIGRMTDQLSGVITDIQEWGGKDVNRRMWIRELFEPNPESEAMYAEYYGKPSPDEQ